MERIRVKAHTVKQNGYIADESAVVEFTGEYLTAYEGFRGEAKVYKTKQGQIAVVYSHNLYSDPVIRVHPDLNDMANYAEGYCDSKYPDYDRGVIGKAAAALGVEPPPIKLDI